jgi:hypothetical protein
MFNNFNGFAALICTVCRSRPDVRTAKLETIASHRTKNMTNGKMQRTVIHYRWPVYTRRGGLCDGVCHNLPLTMSCSTPVEQPDGM